MDRVTESAPVVANTLDFDADPSPDWLFVSLLKQIATQERRFSGLKQYVEGDPPKPDTPDSLSAGESDTWVEFERFRRKSRTNYAELIVGACLDKTTLQGFRTSAAGDEEGDKEAERLWDGNDMDVKADAVLSDMFTYGAGFLLADPFTKRAKAFHPWQALVIKDSVGDPVVGVTIEHNPLERRDYGYLWTRDTDAAGMATGPVWCHIAVRDRENRAAEKLTDEVPRGTYLSRNWVWWESRKTSLEFIPLLDFENREGVGEFERHMDTLDRINHMLLQRVVIATMQAFKQRALKGTFPKHDEQGNVIDYDKLFPTSPGALWLIPPDADLWESGQTTISDILMSVKDDVRDLAATTRTPMTYFSPDAANQSAEGASLQREGYTSKIENRRSRLEGRWRRFMSLMFQINGDQTRAKIEEIEPIWKSVEVLSTTEKYSAGSQAAVMGLSIKTIMREVLQYTPRQMRVADLERISQALTQAAANPVGGTGGVTPLGRSAAANRGAAAGGGGSGAGGAGAGGVRAGGAHSGAAVNGNAG